MFLSGESESIKKEVIEEKEDIDELQVTPTNGWPKVFRDTFNFYFDETYPATPECFLGFGVVPEFLNHAAACPDLSA